MITAPRDGTPFEARSRTGKIFGCHYSERRKDFVNSANNRRVEPYGWRPSKKENEDAETEET